MNRIFAIMLALLLVAGTAYAVEMQTTGSFNVRGSYISNETGLNGAADVPDEEIYKDTASYGYYDQELDITVDLKVSDYTKVITNFEITDMNWTQSEIDDRETTAGAGLDDNIEFKRVFGQHTFSTGTTVQAGLMTGSAWGTSFADTANGVFKVQVMHNGSFGMIGGNIQKEWEEGQPNGLEEDAEKDDGDTIYLFGTFPMGTHRLMPLLRYSDFSNQPAVAKDRDSDGLKIMTIDVAAAGAFGTLGYEAEVVWVNYNQDWDSFDYNGVTYPDGEDFSTYGAYVNVWGNVGATKVGGMVAYGSYDKDGATGFGFGEDFTPTMFGADFTAVGDSSTEKSEYNAVTLMQIYAEFAVSDPLTLFANGTYWMSNSEDNAWEDATGYEIDLGGAYKITENVTYDVLLAYGQFQLDEDATTTYAGANLDDTDAFYRLFHRFTINF